MEGESHDAQLMAKVGDDGAERWQHDFWCDLLTHLGAVEFDFVLHMAVFNVPHEQCTW